MQMRATPWEVLVLSKRATLLIGVFEMGTDADESMIRKDFREFPKLKNNS